jgi:hypothetical protein
LNAVKTTIFLLWFVLVASLGNVSALTPGATENRTWEKSLATGETRQAGPLQTAGGHQEKGKAAYDIASASLLAAEGGANIALGSRYSGLRTFASDIGADHLLDVPNNQWKDVFLSHVDNPSTTFHVNMGGFFGDTPSEMILNEMQSGSHTGWELQQLQQAGRLPQVNFYQPGQLTPIPNPFIK